MLTSHAQLIVAKLCTIFTFGQPRGWVPHFVPKCGALKPSPENDEQQHKLQLSSAASRLRNGCCSILERILLGGILVRSMHECCYEDGQWRTSALGGGLAERRGRAAREGVSIWSM